jgi:hypothetical protein
MMQTLLTRDARSTKLAASLDRSTRLPHPSLRRYGNKALRRTMTSAGIAAVALLVSVGTARADTVIDTTGGWGGNVAIGAFGVPNTATMGQVVTAPAHDTVLSDFTFYMYGSSANPFVPTPITFRGTVYVWDGEKATGSALWESPSRTVTLPQTFEAVTFETGGVQLAAGQQYILFASVSKDYEEQPQATWASLGYRSSDVYHGGGVRWLSNGTDESAWTTSPWGYFAGGVDDLAFIASFTWPVPTSNVAPWAVGNSYAMNLGASLVVSAPGVLRNDSDPNGDVMHAVLVSSPAHGTLTLNANGSLRYTPFEDFIGVDSFKYKTSDGSLQSAAETVRIMVRAVCGGMAATKVGTGDADTITGTSGADVIVGLGGNDTISAWAGDDRVCGGSGADAISAGDGADVLIGGTGNDVLRGELANDRLFGGAGADLLFGADGNDHLDGGANSPDRCDGGPGSDTATGTCEQTTEAHP